MNNFSKIVMIGFMAVALSACQSTKRSHGAMGLDQSGSEARALGEQTSFDEAGGANENRLKAPYNQTYHFEFDKFEVGQDDVPSINAQATYLAANPNAKVRLEGHADDRGSREYNIALGWRRAKAVAAVLQQQGVAMKQIAMVSYGKEKPVAFGHDEDSFAKNRRVELVYESK